jgi:hypothetical protein
VICGGPEFFSQSKTFIRESKDKLISEPQSDSTQGIIHNLALAYSCHFGLAVQTGNH